MNPNLSRRAGRVMMTDAIRRFDFDSHMAFVHAIEQARSFEMLPAWVQGAILEGEQQLADLRRDGSGPVPSTWPARERERPPLM